MLKELEYIELKELEKFKKELEDSKRVVIEDYELTRDSNEYNLVLYCTEDIRHLVTSGRCSYLNEKLEIIGQYESIQLNLLKFEKERLVEPYILGMMYSDLWNLRERCLYVQREENKLIIYSDYSLDTYIKYKEWDRVKESPAPRLLKYVIKTNNSRELLKELELEFFLQEI